MTEPFLAPALRRWYCSSCAAEASYSEASMDPLHPFGYCRAEARPCGRVILCSTLAAAQTLVAETRLRRLLRLHQAHKRDGRYVEGCSDCRLARRHVRHVREAAYDNACPSCREARERLRPTRHVG